MAVHRGRYTAQIDGDFVVFMIGMRFNKPWKVRSWWPVFSTMPKLIRELEQHPQLGCLGGQQWVGRTTVLVQYWQSFDHLDRFSRNPDLPHLEAWRRFNRIVRDSGDVGIWHETYLVKAGGYQCVYGNMPRFGLAKAAEHVAIGAGRQSAAARIGAAEADEPAVEPY